MLEATDFLGVLHESDLEWLVANSNEHDVPPGRVLIRHGELVEFLYLIVDGAFDVTISLPAPRHIATLYAGELAGEMSFVDLQPPSATVSAATQSRVLAIVKSALLDKIRNDAGFGTRFYKGVAVLLADRLRSAYSLSTHSPAGVDPQVEMTKLEERYADIQRRLGLRRRAKSV